MKKQEFVSSIKTKYPVYANVPDDELYNNIIAKYPQYKDQIEEEAKPVAQPEGQSLRRRLMEKLPQGVQTAASVGPALLSGATLGVSDWAPALLSAGTEAVQGKGFHPVDQLREIQGQREEDLGKYGNMAAEIAGGFAGGGLGLAKTAATTTAKALPYVGKFGTHAMREVPALAKVGEFLSKPTPSKVLGNLAKGTAGALGAGTEGALTAGATSVIQARPEDAMESMGYGALLGGVGQPVLSGLGKATGAMKNAIVGRAERGTTGIPSEKFAEYNAIGNQPEGIKDESFLQTEQRFKNLLEKYGIYGGGDRLAGTTTLTGNVKKQAENATKQVGQQLGSLRNQAGEVIKDAPVDPKFLSRIRDLAVEAASTDPIAPGKIIPEEKQNLMLSPVFTIVSRSGEIDPPKSMGELLFRLQDKRDMLPSKTKAILNGERPSNPTDTERGIARAFEKAEEAITEQVGTLTPGLQKPIMQASMEYRMLKDIIEGSRSQFGKRATQGNRAEGATVGGIKSGNIIPNFDPIIARNADLIEKVGSGYNASVAQFPRLSGLIGSQLAKDKEKK